MSRSQSLSFSNALDFYANDALGDQGVSFNVREKGNKVLVTMTDFEDNFFHYSIPKKKWDEKTTICEANLVGVTAGSDQFNFIMDTFCNWLYEQPEE